METSEGVRSILNLAFITDWGAYYRNYSWTVNLVHICIDLAVVSSSSLKDIQIAFFSHIFLTYIVSEHRFLLKMHTAFQHV